MHTPQEWALPTKRAYFDHQVPTSVVELKEVPAGTQTSKAVKGLGEDGYLSEAYPKVYHKA